MLPSMASSPTPAFSSPEMVACTSVSGHSSMLWPCNSGELVAEASAGRAGFVGVLPVVLNGDRYGLLPDGNKQLYAHVRKGCGVRP